MVSRFRLSCHNLRVETGRHQIPYIRFEEILCDLCHVLGDEVHHLLYCKKYDEERDELFKTLGCSLRDEIELVGSLLVSEEVIIIKLWPSLIDTQV